MTLIQRRHVVATLYKRYVPAGTTLILYILKESNFTNLHVGMSGYVIYIIYIILEKNGKTFANNGFPDQMPQSSTPNLSALFTNLIPLLGFAD